jgi:hypothetical protein
MERSEVAMTVKEIGAATATWRPFSVLYGLRKALETAAVAVVQAFSKSLWLLAFGSPSRNSNGRLQDVTVTADNIFNAIAMLERGKGIVRQPYEAR